MNFAEGTYRIPAKFYPPEKPVLSTSQLSWLSHLPVATKGLESEEATFVSPQLDLPKTSSDKKLQFFKNHCQRVLRGVKEPAFSLIRLSIRLGSVTAQGTLFPSKHKRSINK